MTAISPVARDEHLVVAVQAGSHEAFAALFLRYRPEITRYAGRILTDDARAEDVVQETFLSALRSIDALDRPEGFKPWLYRIAHNACVDQMRRRARTEEVLFDVQVLPASDEIRLFRQAPSSHAALALKEDFEHLRQALGDLPEAQARILVLRELEGLSYEEIAERMGISHSAVESMLFRARRSLKDEFGEISSGERCRRMRALMGQVVEGVGSGKDRRRLVRHVRSCTACRRDAFVMGLGPLVDVDRRGGLRGGLSRVAALLPLPGFLNRRSEETDQLAASSSSSTTTMSLATHAQNVLSHVTISAGTSVEHAATAIQKAAAVVAAAAVVGGGGFVASETRTHPAPPPAVAKHMKDTRAPGFAPARPGAVFTSPLPLSLAPLAGGPPATVLAPDPTPAAPPAETTPPAETAPATTEPETTTPPATESAGPEAPSQSFDSTSSSPEPTPEPTVEIVADPVPPEPAPEPAPAPDPPVDEQPPLVPLSPGDGGSGTPPDQQPSGDTGGSGPVS